MRLSRYINKQKQKPKQKQKSENNGLSVLSWQLKKDAQCIRIHGYGWHYDIDTYTTVKD
jgi:hypothetical protein